MLSREKKKDLRSDLFRYLDGLVTVPVAYSLKKKGVLDFLLKKGKVGIEDVVKEFKANEGYLNVALRVLVSQGWLEMELDNSSNKVVYQVNEKSSVAFAHCHLYEDVYQLLIISGEYHKRLFEKKPFTIWLDIVEKYKNGYGLEETSDVIEKEIQNQILKHIEGNLVCPSTVALGMNKMFHKYFMEHSFRPEEFHKDSDSFTKLLDFFSYLGWFNKDDENYSFTDKGMFFARRATAFGVTVSYNPTFRNLEQLIFGNPNTLWNKPDNSPERHVDREMNVWGSGGAHSAYFKVIDEIVISLFNQPIEKQPKGIVDMGCGNGAYLIHLFEVIEKRTERGKMLDDYPLFLVGADYNKVALDVTRRNLIQADIWAKVIWGDISRPDILARDLESFYGIQLEDLLNVRTFLDHNRIWAEPKEVSAERTSGSTGAFSFRGERLSNNSVEDNLLEHFKLWSPYVKKFGLLLIELHTIPPLLVAENIGKTAATAYDATHGFSDQFIVEIDVFHKVAKEAGLFPDMRHFHRFPNSDLATVSINLLKGKD